MRIRCLSLLGVFILSAAGVSFGQSSAADLDEIAKRVIAQERVAGASVLVARGNRILLHKGYGFADLGL